MSDDFSSIPVKDFATLGIELKVTCRTCGRSRIIYGGVLPRNFAPEDRLHQHQLNQFARRFVCGGCEGRWPKAELVKPAG